MASARHWSVPRRRPEYQTETTDDMRDSIWAAGEIAPLELFRIAAWKSARGLASLTLNSEVTIRRTTSEALERMDVLRTVDVVAGAVDWEEWTTLTRSVVGSKSAGSGLLGLAGVGYPMASALLAYLAPRVWPVLDKWTVLAIFGDDAGLRSQRAIAYAAFTRRLRELAPLHYTDCVTIHQVDQAVMNAIMGCQEPRDACSHVPYPPIPVPT